MGEDESSTFGELIEFDGETPEEQVSKSLLREDLESVLDALTPGERDVLRLRYGWDDGREKTLKEIGNIFKITRERIRQIEHKALQKLRKRRYILREYLD
jgi:RNA polymerase primary sigma factor